MSSPLRRGFTLIEMMIVVAIIAILVSVSVFVLQRSRDTVSLEKAISQVRSVIEESRSLATLAGSRAGTPRLINDGSCNFFPNQMGVTIDPGAGTVNYPSEVQINPATADMTVTCENWDIPTNVRELPMAGVTAAFSEPAGVTQFAFSPTGHLIPPTPVFVRIAAPADRKNPGLRIFASGVMCSSSDPGGGTPCDESQNW